MPRLPRTPPLFITALAALSLAGCGTHTPSASAFCEVGTAPVLAALRSAPAVARLKDGTPLSQCISGATDAGDSQDVGIAFVMAAEQLEPPALRDPRAALELGYLVGATQRGARHTNGVMAELVHRIELVAGRLTAGGTAAARTALARGLRIGEARG